MGSAALKINTCEIINSTSVCILLYSRASSAANEYKITKRNPSTSVPEKGKSGQHNWTLTEDVLIWGKCAFILLLYPQSLYIWVSRKFIIVHCLSSPSIIIIMLRLELVMIYFSPRELLPFNDGLWLMERLVRDVSSTYLFFHGLQRCKPLIVVCKNAATILKGVTTVISYADNAVSFGS